MQTDGGATAPNTIEGATGEFDQNCPNIPHPTNAKSCFSVSPKDFLAVAAQKVRPGEQSVRRESGVSELARKCSHFRGDSCYSGSRSLSNKYPNEFVDSSGLLVPITRLRTEA